MKCEDVIPEIEAYAIGILEPETMAEMKQHIQGCENCRAALEQYTLTMETLALEAGSALALEELPDGHKDRFMAKLQQRPQLRPDAMTVEEIAEARRATPKQPETSPQPRRRSLLGRLIPAAFSLMAALIIGLSIWSVNLQSQLNQQQNQYRVAATQLAQKDEGINNVEQINSLLRTQILALSSERDNLQTQVKQQAELNEKLALSQNVSLLLNKPGATTRSNSNDKFGVTVLMAPSEKGLALFAHSWPQLKEDEEYRLWLNHTTGVVIPAGALKLTPLPGQPISETFVTAPESMDNYTNLFVTIEKKGSQSPSTPPIVSDKLA